MTTHDTSSDDPMVDAGIVHEPMRAVDRVVERERDRFSGVKFGSAFFGWLAATGMGALLTALLVAVGAVVGLTVEDAAEVASGDADAAAIAGAIGLLVVLFVSYFAGGYVAGRMARFSGGIQGLAVWLWAVVIAIVFAVVTALAGDRYNVLADLNSFPRIPLSEGDLTTIGVVTAALIAVVTLVGAVLGGMTGMRYHRRVDAVGFGGS